MARSFYTAGKTEAQKQLAREWRRVRSLMYKINKQYGWKSKTGLSANYVRTALTSLGYDVYNLDEAIETLGMIHSKADLEKILNMGNKVESENYIPGVKDLLYMDNLLENLNNANPAIQYFVRDWLGRLSETFGEDYVDTAIGNAEEYDGQTWTSDCNYRQSAARRYLRSIISNFPESIQTEYRDQLDELLQELEDNDTSEEEDFWEWVHARRRERQKRYYESHRSEINARRQHR